MYKNGCNLDYTTKRTEIVPTVQIHTDCAVYAHAYFKRQVIGLTDSHCEDHYLSAHDEVDTEIN